MAVQELNGDSFSSEIALHKVAIVDFYASWCGSCRLFAPTYDKVAAEYEGIAFFKVDGDEYPNTREGLEIDNLPFVAIYENGKPIGGMNITKEDMLRDLLDKVRKKAGI